MRLPHVSAASKPLPEQVHTPAPGRYRGVWARTLLETPEGRDTTTFVRWLQTSQWHADLRIPNRLNHALASGQAQQQGFCGITQIAPPVGDTPEICTWHRHLDFQPPRSTPDAGTMVFEAPDRVIERGVHGDYLEVWERLPESLGRRIVLQRLNASGQPTAERLLLAGACFMHVRPRSALWPDDLRPDETLVDVLERHPAQAAGLLDFEISFGKVDVNEWVVHRSTLPAREGVVIMGELQRWNEHTARFEQGPLAGDWQVEEWSDKA